MGLESIELVMAWEEHFGISIPNELAVTLETPRKTIDAIEVLLKDRPNEGRAWSRSEIEHDVCEIIVEQTAIRRQDFTLDSRYIRDMGID